MTFFADALRINFLPTFPLPPWRLGISNSRRLRKPAVSHFSLGPNQILQISKTGRKYFSIFAPTNGSGVGTNHCVRNRVALNFPFIVRQVGGCDGCRYRKRRPRRPSDSPHCRPGGRTGSSAETVGRRKVDEKREERRCAVGGLRRWRGITRMGGYGWD